MALAPQTLCLDPLESHEIDELHRQQDTLLTRLDQVVRPTPFPFPWAKSLLTLGITGTNGKSSTTHLAAAILEAEGHDVLTESTVGYFFKGQKLEVPRTIQGFMAALKHAAQAGAKRAVVETTSNALARSYAKIWRYDDAVFTNLTQEHIEAHGSWEHYLACKAQLFVHLGPDRTAALNANDPASRLLDAVIPPDVHRRWYGVGWRGHLEVTPELLATDCELGPEGTLIRLAPGPLAESLGGELRLRFVGEVFAENALGAALGTLAQGADPLSVKQGLATCPPLSGRFEVVSDEPLVAVDYAHTPDAVERVAATGRHLAKEGRLMLVFGAGGGSSPVKREALGRAAGEAADWIWVTNDNPRQDDPSLIARQVAAGARRGGRAYVQVELDRKKAIEQALNQAKASDVILILGKGHEQTQEIGQEKLHFSDQEVVRGFFDRVSSPG